MIGVVAVSGLAEVGGIHADNSCRVGKRGEHDTIRDFIAIGAFGDDIAGTVVEIAVQVAFGIDAGNQAIVAIVVVIGDVAVGIGFLHYIADGIIGFINMRGLQDAAHQGLRLYGGGNNAIDYGERAGKVI